MRIGAAEIRGVLAGALAVLLLMWPAVVNRQPFFFSDSTSYIRAADFVAHRLSGGRIATRWTARYDAPASLPPPAPAAPATPKATAGNDVASGSIMSGRSPYFGELLWLSEALDFWPFVLGQALTAWLLLRAAFRLFGFAPPAALWATAALALLTGLPFYDAMLMPDALAGFGILAMLLLAIDRGRLGRGERVFAVAVMLVSAVSHLTHIVMFLGMALALGAAAPVRRWGIGWRPALPIAAATVTAGLASVALTSAVVARVFHKPPQLVPLLTSRTIEDGPGRDLIRSGCDDGRFAVCGVPQAAHTDALRFLWSDDPRYGVFMVVDPVTRARISAEDTRFFLAAARAEPVAAAAAAARNSFLQMIDFRNQGINQRGWNWNALPDADHARLAATPTGRDAWPTGLLDVVHYGAVLAALAALAAALARPALLRTPAGGDLALWAALFLVAMLVNDVLGGAVSIPQYRYQARIIWLVPLLGLLAARLLRGRQARA